MIPFRKIIYTTVNNRLLQRNPFFAYSITKEETKRSFLTTDEIKLLINGTFKKKSYEVIRTPFIFCTFTGLSWTNMTNMTKANLQTSFDGHLWIITNRQKTDLNILHGIVAETMPASKHFMQAMQPATGRLPG